MIRSIETAKRLRASSSPQAGVEGVQGFSTSTWSDLLTPELRRRIGPQSWGELSALVQERDPELFFEGLLAFGYRQEQAGNVEFAAQVYAALGDLQNAIPEGSLPERSLRQRAQGRLHAILGQGSIGPRAEFLLRRLAQESCEPSSLLAMGAAGALFKVVQLGTLSRLAAASSANFFTRGLGARALASIAAFSVEAPVFTLTSHVAATALGRRQDWSHLGNELASSYLVLGGMRLAGWGANALSAGAGPSLPLRVTLQQSGMLGGILLGHRLEEAFGFRARRDGATTLLDSLALLLQFNIAGDLTRHAFGERFHHWEQGLEFQTENFDKITAPALATISELPLEAAGTFNGTLYMTAIKRPYPGHGGGGGPTVADRINDILQEMREEPPLSTTRQKLLQSIEVHFDTDQEAVPLSQERLDFYRDALLLLLAPETGPERLPLRGYLGSALRSNRELRESLPSVAAGEGQKVWAKFEGQRHQLRQLIFLEQAEGVWRPRRILLGYPVLRYDENQDPAVYDLEFRSGQPGTSAFEIHASVYKNDAHNRYMRDEYMTQRFSPEAEIPMRRWQLYPKSSYHLTLELAGGLGSFELPLLIRDLHFHTLVSLPAMAPKANGGSRRS